MPKSLCLPKSTSVTARRRAIEKTEGNQPAGPRDKRSSAIPQDAPVMLTDEEKTRQIETRYRQLVENMPGVLWTKDINGQTSFISPAVENIFGFTPQEILSSPAVMWQNRIHRDDAPMVTQAIKNLFEKNERYDIEYRIERKDGKWIWLHDRSIGVYASGGILKADGLLTDITERKQMEQTLRQEEAKMRAILDHTYQFIGLLTTDGTVIEANRSALEFSGIAADCVANKPFWETPWWSHSPALQAKLRLAIKQAAQGILARFEATHPAKDGTLHSIDFSIKPIKDDSGKVIFLIPEGRDITDLKQAEEARHEVERMYRVIFEGSSVGIITADYETKKIGHVNPATCRMLGYTLAELTHMNITDLHPAESAQQTLASFEALVRGEISLARAIPCRRKDGGIFYADISNAQIIAHNKKWIVGFFTDVTERKRFEDQLRKNNLRLDELVQARTAELDRSNKELEQFAYVASHDLQEPLRMVSSYLQLLARRYQGKLDKNADEFIGYAVDGAKRMQKMISDLLQFSRIGKQGYAIEKVDCAMALQQALSNLKLTIQEHGAVIVHGPLPVINIDQARITQLFQNLIDNAIKYHGQAAPRIQISAVWKNAAGQEAPPGGPQGGEWIFSFQDNGIGIDPAFYDRVFVIFQRLHPPGKYPGTGIGLATCKKIVDQYKGRIWVESQPNQGSTFYFSIPAIVPENTVNEQSPRND